MSERSNISCRAKSFDRQTTFVVLVLLVLSGSSMAGNAAENEKPNVVLIYIDDLGYGDLGVYGCTDIPTPNIDRLAEEGVRCTASYIVNSGFMEVARIPPPKQHAEVELAGASESLKRQLADKDGKSKYFCLNEDGETVWLTDYRAPIEARE